MRDQPQSALPDPAEVNAYIRPPDAAVAAQPWLASYLKPDTFGMEDRLDALRQTLRGGEGKPNNFGHALDLGGNCGYFTLSLMSDGLVASARVEDINEAALALGRVFADSMGLAGSIDFRNSSIDLAILEALDEAVDLVISMNLIHHAGSVFDVDVVREIGWEAYARRWMVALRRVAGMAVIGVGFKGAKPAEWSKSHRFGVDFRPSRFGRVCADAGWDVLYDANVRDLSTLGYHQANGRRRRMQGMMSVDGYLRKAGFRSPTQDAGSDKKGKYHLFILR